MIYRGSLSAVALVAMAASSAAQAQALACPLGADWENAGVFTLVMERPAIGEVEIVNSDGPVAENAVLARRVIRFQPKSRYLAADARLSGPDAEKLGQAVPLTKDSLITSWRAGGQTRDCSIGWKNGLFGGATGDGHYRWICLEDRDGDGAYDTAFRTQTKNMGLSYARLDIPLAAPVRTVAESGTAALPKNTGALGGRDLEQLLTVRSVKKDRVRLRLESISRRDREDIDLPNVAGSTAAIGGFTVTVVSAAGKDVVLRTAGRFADPKVEPVCDGSFYSIDGLSAQVTFPFPNW